MPFQDCEALVHIEVDPNNKKYDSRNHCNGVVETETNTLVAGCKKTILPDTLEIIGNRAFEHTAVTDVSIKEGTKEIKESAFSCCDCLKKIYLPKSMNKIGKDAFYGCRSLKVVDIPEKLTRDEEKKLAKLIAIIEKQI